MYFKNLKVEFFRNHTHTNLSFNKSVNILLGDNAQGKTSILEALFMMSLGKSFRTTKEYETIQFGQTHALLKSEYIKEMNGVESKNDIKFLIEKKGKQVLKNQMKVTKFSEMSEDIFVVIFSPEDLKIVKEDPDKRRKFMDRELCQLSYKYLKNLLNYKKSLSNRNILLKKEGLNRDHLSVWDEYLIRYGSKIIFDRINFIKKLSGISQEIYANIADEKEVLTLEYFNNIGIGSMSTEIEIEKKYREKMGEALESDINKRMTSIGPHKDDIKILIDEKEVRKYGSQGQQRTAALSLKLGEIKLIREETNENPVLLLDDVLSELDLNRQTFLINSLKDIQIFITSTHIDQTIIEKLPEYTVYYLKEGSLIS